MKREGLKISSRNLLFVVCQRQAKRGKQTQPFPLLREDPQQEGSWLPVPFSASADNALATSASSNPKQIAFQEVSRLASSQQSRPFILS
jgi:hypothetical protein